MKLGRLQTGDRVNDIEMRRNLGTGTRSFRTAAQSRLLFVRSNGSAASCGYIMHSTGSSGSSVSEGPFAFLLQGRDGAPIRRAEAPATPEQSGAGTPC